MSKSRKGPHADRVRLPAGPPTSVVTARHQAGERPALLIMDTEKLKGRLLSKVVAGPNGCWVWTGHCGRGGYPAIWNSSGSTLAHRVSYELHVGPIPPGLVIDHLCRNVRCIFPGHLEAVTPRENWRRSDAVTRINADKTECSSGHPFDEKNTRMYRGSRFCRRCERDRSRRRAKSRARDHTGHTPSVFPC